MLLNKKIVVVMPAYNAALTLQRTLAEIPTDIVDEIVLVDDCSTDKTLEVANVLGLKHVIPHEENKGYGGKFYIALAIMIIAPLFMIFWFKRRGLV
jgi:glycosyltransferase involved in cell wall biosynthesis